ncbi:MAG: phosphate ABC transporter permease PstA [Ardenticatenaceae bacterium]|nr:phosphate ABC transporter permease PstA [Ardenticatenaceae bacterium]
MADQQKYYPEGESLAQQINRRHRNGSIWRYLFLASTVIAIVVLIALLYNILNQAFGLVAVQTMIAPDSLVRVYNEELMISASNTTTSEDDNVLVEGIVGDENGVGFFGYAYFLKNNDHLRTVAVDGIAPSANTVADGSYPLARPLYIYTTAEILAEKPQVSAFVDYYLQNSSEVIGDVGYFPAPAESLTASLSKIGSPASINDAAGEILIAGSSTVFPLSQRIADDFQAAGFAGNVSIESVGSTAGMRAFCVDESVDIANASRPITQAEREACRANGREPLELQVGNDALVVVVNPANEFATDLTSEQLTPLFSSASSWSEISSAYPNQPIDRYIPGLDSGTLDFFSEAAFGGELSDLPKEDLIQILAANISVGLGRRLERDQRFYDDTLIFESQELWNEVCASDEPATGCTLPARTTDDVYRLVLERVVEPQVVETWPLLNSLTNRSEIIAEAAVEHPDATVEFRSWLTGTFVTSPQSSEPELAGVRTAILGSLWVIGITILFSFPVGVGAAIYLEEYASKEKPINRMIQTNINNLAGVPSIIYGMLGLAIFVRVLETFTSGAFLGTADGSTANGRTIISAGLTLGLLILPIIIIASQEALRAVPISLRQASFGLGATKWQTIWFHVLPSALPGILTGTILAMSRAIGETAPLVVIGASTFVTVDPTGPFSKFTVLPIQIYQWTARPQAEFRNIAAAAIVVLLTLLLTLNATAVFLRNRFSMRS